jgi:hypothetical protein
MSTATGMAPLPLFQEGNEFWKHLTDECRSHAELINLVAAENGLSVEHCVNCTSGSEFRILKATYPSTLIRLRIGFYSWAPMISVAVSGDEAEHLQFFPSEFEMPISKDLDGSVIAIFDEGRSFSPKELATYLTQTLRRCFPGLCLH